MSSKIAGHAFISYVREDSSRVDSMQEALEATGIPVWRDTNDLWAGEDWRSKIRHAITDSALVFIACFSRASLDRDKSYQNEELTLAIEQLRLRRPDQPWLIPVRLDECDIPDLDIGGGRTLASIQRVDLFGASATDGIARICEGVLRILDHSFDKRSSNNDWAEQDAVARRITEFCSKAAEQLSHQNALVRQDGLYALERLADKHPTVQQTVVNLICAYLCVPYVPPAEINGTPGTGATTSMQEDSADLERRRQEFRVRRTAQEILRGHLRPEDEDDRGQPSEKYWPDIHLDLAGATLVNFDLSHCLLLRARFDQTHFIGHTTFSSAHFTGTKSGQLQLEGISWFDGATFEGVAWFDNTQFAMGVGFRKAHFSEAFWFRSAKLDMAAWFDDSHFHGAANFDRTQFTGDTSFKAAVFEGDSDFSGAHFTCKNSFTGDTRFQKAKFNQAANFMRSGFSGIGNFAEVEFSGDVRFEDAWFGWPPRFPKARARHGDQYARTWPDGWKEERTSDMICGGPTAGLNDEPWNAVVNASHQEAR